MLDVARDLAAGWLGGASGIVASHPLDIARVRIQVGDAVRPSLVGELTSMLRHEGMASLARGIVAPVLSVGLWKAVIFAGTEQVHAWQSTGPNGPSLLQHSIAGFGGGVCGTFIQTPLENVKLNAQINRGPATVAYEWEVARTIVANRGWMGLYRGLPLCYLCSPTSYACWFPLNELCLRAWRCICSSPADASAGASDSFVGTLACGALSGSAAWVVAYPGDKAKAIWATSKAATYRECFQPRLQAEGVLRLLYSGLAASVIRGIPQCAFTMLGYRVAQRMLPRAEPERAAGAC